MATILSGPTKPLLGHPLCVLDRQDIELRTLKHREEFITRVFTTLIISFSIADPP